MQINGQGILLVPIALMVIITVMMMSRSPGTEIRIGSNPYYLRVDLQLGSLVEIDGISIELTDMSATSATLTIYDNANGTVETHTFNEPETYELQRLLYRELPIRQGQLVALIQLNEPYAVFLFPTFIGDTRERTPNDIPKTSTSLKDWKSD